MARPPRIESRELVQQIGVVRPNPVQPSGLLEAGRVLGNYAGQMAQEAEVQRIDTARQEGFSAGLQRDETGALIPVELRKNDSPENRAFNAAITHSYMNGLENDYRRRAPEFRLESSTPDEFSARWEAYLKENTANLPDELRAQALHIGDGIGIQHTNGMLTAERERGYRNAQSEWQTKHAARADDILVMAQAGETDTEAYAQALARMTEHNMEGVQAGYWTEEAATLDLAMISDEGEANAMVAVGVREYERAGGGAAGLAAAQAVADQITGDTALTMDPARRGQYARQILSRVNQMEIQQNAEARERRVEASRAMDAARQRMYAGVDLPASEAGRVSALVNASGDPELMREWRDQQSLAGDISAWQAMGPAELNAHIETSLRPATVNDGATAMEYASLNAAETVLSNVVKSVQADPMAYADRIGLTTLQPVDPFDTASLQMRAQSADQVSGKYGTSFKLWTEAEIEQLTGQMAVATPEERVAFARSITTALPGRQSAAAFQQLSGGDTGLAYVGGMVASDPRLTPVAVSVERGRRVRTENPDWMKSQNFTQATLDAAFNAYQPVLLKLADGTMEAVKEAALNDFAARGGSSVSAFEESVQRVLGGIADGGGIQSVNGVETLLPIGVTASDFEDAISRISFPQMSELSRSGNPPLYSDQTMAMPDEIADAQFVATATNRYMVFVGNRVLKDINGENYEITLTPETVARLVR